MEFIKEQSRIYAEDNSGKVIAEITFPKVGEDYCINHTFVDDSLRGQGVASKLVEMAVEEIRSAGGKVTATCPYAVRWLEKKSSEDGASNS